MNVCGIIAEYNPMHNGHIYHINKSKKITSSTHTVAIISGNFVQRGEPSIVNKWTKTKMALNNGIDLVIELPFVSSISSAEGFCYSAIKTLDSLNVVNSVCFGSEQGSIDDIKIISKILINEPLDYKNLLKDNLKKGLSYPKSRQLALNTYIHTFTNKNIDSSLISLSNNILSIEYIKALLKLKSNIKPFTLKRVNNLYNNKNLSGNISSATSIRENILTLDSIKDSIPINNFELLKNDIENNIAPITLNTFSDIILYKLRESSLEYIESLMDVSEGLEYKIKKECDICGNINDLIDNVSSKRYPKTRIQRILLYAVFGITKKVYMENLDPSYIRILGFNNKGREILKKAKKVSSLPIITMPNSTDINFLKYDILSTDIYSLGYKNSIFKNGKYDLITPPVYVNKWFLHIIDKVFINIY